MTERDGRAALEMCRSYAGPERRLSLREPLPFHGRTVNIFLLL